MSGEARRGRAWASGAFALGMLVSGGLAALESTRVGEAQRELPAGVVARVGELTITEQELEDATEALARDRREGARAGDREYVLGRLVDEALLVQLALDQGLALRDPRTRADLTAAALQLLVTEAELDEPSEDELRALHAQRSEELRGAPRVRVEHRYASGADALARVQRDDVAEGGATLDAPPLPLPSGFVGERELRDVFGSTFAAAVLTSPVDVWLPPLERGGGVHRVRVVARDEPEAPPFEAVRAELVALHRRERADEALRAYLASAREDTEIVVRDEDAP